MDSEAVVAQLQRKIELQSPDDLAYLIANVRRAAAAHLDTALPVKDRMYEDMAKLVDEYVNRTFTFAAPNITINGMPVDPAPFLAAASSSTKSAEPVYEPFDARKRRRVADLITQEEKLLEEVAALKRSVPASAAAAHAEHLRAGLARDDAQMEARSARAAATAAEQVDLDAAPLKRQAHVEAGFRGAVDALGRLKRDMPAVVAKMERARVAGEYVVTQGR